jgi:hypothetical protein
MHKILFICKGTIGSILACYIKRIYDVMVLEYELNAADILADTTTLMSEFQNAECAAKN